MQDKKSLSKALVDLQTQTGAPSSFVRRIESELLSRGIPLDEDASPYIESLEEAFIQDLCNREDPLHVRDNIEELQATYFNLKGEHDRLTFRMEAIADALRKHMSHESDTVAFGVVPGPETVN